MDCICNEQMIEGTDVRYFSKSKVYKVHDILRQDFSAVKKKNSQEVQEYKQ
jgi:hypothetical protein